MKYTKPGLVRLAGNRTAYLAQCVSGTAPQSKANAQTCYDGPDAGACSIGDSPYGGGCTAGITYTTGNDCVDGLGNNGGCNNGMGPTGGCSAGAGPGNGGCATGTMAKKQGGACGVGIDPTY